MTENKNLKTFLLKEMLYYRIHGRTNEKHFPLPLFFNGSAVEVNVTGSELWIDIETDFDIYEPWVCTFINGALISRQMLLPGSQSLCLFRGMSPETVKNVKFMRETQPMEEDEALYILVNGFRSDGFFVPLSGSRLKLEFIGDSITSGEGLYGAKEDMDWIPMYMSAGRTYAQIVSKALGAEYRLFSQGGWGVLSGWNNNPHHNIPSRYEKVCALAGGKLSRKLGADMPCDFEGWQPDAVIVNLGTNDAGAFDQPPWQDPQSGEIFKQRRDPDGAFNPGDLARFKQAVNDFLIMLRKNNPSSHIVWTYGMLGQELTPAIADTVHSYCRISGDRNTAFVPLPDTTAETVGSRRHPGPESHKRAALVLTEYLRKILV